MRLPDFSTAQFLNAQILDSSSSLIKSSMEDKNTSFYTPGLVNSSSLIFTYNNNLIVNLNASIPFRILDANGILSTALGVTNGTTSAIYSLDFTSFVPSSGSVTVYITATTYPLYLQPYQVIGPPIGHPDYNPNFVPYTAYVEIDDSLNIVLSTTAPNNTTIFELGRVVLTAGEINITSVNTSYQVNCNLYISAIEVQPVRNAIQIGQISGSNTAIVAGVIPSGITNNLIQFLVNGSNVFYVDIDGNITSAGNLNLNGTATVGTLNATTLDVSGTANVGGLLTSDGLNSNANIVVNAPGAQVALKDTTPGQATPNKFFESYQGNFVVANSANTANILTLTDSGNLTIPGTATIAPSATSNQAVQQGQVANISPALSDVPGNTNANSTSTTSVTFTAPCDGYVFGIAKLISGSVQPYGIQFNILINGATGQSDNTLLSMIEFQAEFFSGGSSITVEATATTPSSGNAAAFNIGVAAFFIPAP